LAKRSVVATSAAQVARTTASGACLIAVLYPAHSTNAAGSSGTNNAPLSVSAKGVRSIGMGW
jgi:hypothetical protein